MPPDSEPIANLDALAAVDLGSNSFHMLVARVVDHEVHVVDRIKERVALAEGLDDNHFLNLEARDRALACLEQFGQRIAHIPPGLVRAVGTNTLRKARNARNFLARAQATLGHPIEIIAGREEARLVYLGVTQSIGGIPERRLVVDIGGGSTECIIGEGFEPTLADSLFMGCVSRTRRFFPEGVLTADRFRRAIIEAALEVQPIARSYREAG
ncbi:MAG: exopolyphosphatase, partial [Deltaproteobacteria bacterium]|nr:exopolyphosphatase [Deltaproteobacteria bacterium]